MNVAITTLWAVNTAEHIFAWGLDIATALGLPTSTWRTGDPTRALYKYLAEVLAEKDNVVTTWIKAGFLSSAVEDAKASGSSEWLKVLAYEMYGVSVPAATYATPTVTLMNAGGGRYPKGIGEITVKASSTGKTYRNTNAPAPLFAGVTVVYELVADEPGSASSAGVDEIDEIVTTMLGVVIDSSTAGYAADERTPDEIGAQCADSLGALSPAGPPDAYNFVCKNSELTGTTEVTRVSSSGESTTGEVGVVVASATGPVSSASVALCDLAVNKYARPLAIAVSVFSATPLTVAVTASIVGDGIPSDAEETIEAEIAEYLAAVAIGGFVYRSALIAAIHRAVPQVDSATLTVPAADVALDDSEVPVLGVVTITEV